MTVTMATTSHTRNPHAGGRTALTFGPLPLRHGTGRSAQAAEARSPRRHPGDGARALLVPLGELDRLP